jgi:antitoxin CptB
MNAELMDDAIGLGNASLVDDTVLVAQLDSCASPDDAISERALSKLRWRSRRGLLENDLFVERFFTRYASELTVRQGNSLNALMDLSDNDLLDVHLGRKKLQAVRADLDTPDVQQILKMLMEKVERKPQ